MRPQRATYADPKELVIWDAVKHAMWLQERTYMHPQTAVWTGPDGMTYSGWLSAATIDEAAGFTLVGQTLRWNDDMACAVFVFETERTVSVVTGPGDLPEHHDEEEM